MRLVIGGAAAVAALVGASVAAADIVRHATTTSFSLTLSLGKSEMMFTQAEVKAKHPTTGEVMVGMSSTMSAGGMTMGGTARHLEVNVRSRATGKVVTNVMPAISLTDTTTNGMTDKLDVMAMQGVGEGVADLHYGNNVSLTLNHRYRVVVRLKGEQATFTFKAA
jgi:hypothetical protein